ncbi:hypothetical protein KIPB_013044, partial [Kipferlia bialata]
FHLTGAMLVARALTRAQEILDKTHPFKLGSLGETDDVPHQMEEAARVEGERVVEALDQYFGRSDGFRQVALEEVTTILGRVM